MKTEKDTEIFDKWVGRLVLLHVLAVAVSIPVLVLWELLVAIK